jgi:hypothetical protein
LEFVDFWNLLPVIWKISITLGSRGYDKQVRKGPGPSRLEPGSHPQGTQARLEPTLRSQS